MFEHLDVCHLIKGVAGIIKLYVLMVIPDENAIWGPNTGMYKTL